MDRVRVLIVDDEQDFLRLFIKRFSLRNLKVEGAGSGAEALKALGEKDYDVVVLDVKMPGLDGIQTLKEIKKRHPHIEVIMLTGHGSVKSGIEGMSHGAFDYVLKPFEIDDLQERILKAHERKLLSRRH